MAKKETNKPDMNGFDEADVVQSRLEGEESQITIKGGFHDLWSSEDEASDALEEIAPHQAHIEILSADPKSGRFTLIRLHKSQAELLYVLLGVKLRQANDWHNMVVKPFLDKHIARIKTELQKNRSPTTEDKTKSVPRESEIEEATSKSLPPKHIPMKTDDWWVMVFANYREVLQISEPWRPEYAMCGMPPELRNKVKSSFFKLPTEEQMRIRAYLRSWYFPDIAV